MARILSGPLDNYWSRRASRAALFRGPEEVLAECRAAQNILSIIEEIVV